MKITISMRFAKILKGILALLLFVMFLNPAGGQLQHMGILNDPVDISGDFRSFSNIYYVADHMVDFDPATATGKVVYNRHAYTTNKAFSNMNAGIQAVRPNEFPSGEYEVSPALPFTIEFISSRTVRLRAESGVIAPGNRDRESVMLVNNDMPPSREWQYSAGDGNHIYTSPHGRVIISENPWKVEFYDEDGKLLTSTNHFSDNNAFYTPVLPFSWVRRSEDYSRSFSATFNLFPGEKIFGFGEMFTEFNKRGQKVILGIDDAHGSQNESSHKPAPFFMSDRGYGMFIHTSSPVTCDVGKYFSGVHSMYIGDEELDLFVFLGQPKHILDEYTSVTGKASMPPLWSFGFWMSRITYFSEADAREVADKLRANRIPSDVIHLDTGWFETDWRCDYRFAESRFDDPQKMINDLKDQGFHISLWQLPYFVPQNELFPEIVEKGLFIKNSKGNVPFEDAILDFTNPGAVEWYREKLGALLEMGVGAIKVDFGEAAPWKGLYHNGRTGFYEHNLYPTRYNKIVADLTREVRGENIIWARSGWAGSQRYPVHWGGDAGNTSSAMAGTLRGGLSIGLSGYTFWSHDVGGFVTRTPVDLYRRWMAFGVFSSHTRSHGHPPKEPWEFGEDFMNYFRDALNMRYRLMPYIYAQAKHSSENGLPMLRALFIEYPDDPGAWRVDDQYLFGQDFLVAPIFEDVESRDVYLPGNHRWIDYQSGETFNPGWNHIEVGEIEAVILVREGAVIPHIALAQSTKDMDWSDIELRVFGNRPERAEALICLPADNVLENIVVERRGGRLEIAGNPLAGRTRIRITEMGK
jgi:alpha-D-xyloside xylohydrolase